MTGPPLELGVCVLGDEGGEVGVDYDRGPIWIGIGGYAGGTQGNQGVGAAGVEAVLRRQALGIGLVLVVGHDGGHAAGEAVEG
jgi:hypothetical protein